MQTYTVRIKITIFTTVEVEADSEEEAIDRAEELESDASWNEYEEIDRETYIVDGDEYECDDDDDDDDDDDTGEE